MGVRSVAFQGERGAYSEAAALEYFGNSIEPIACPTFDEVFEKVEGGAVDHGIVPVENSLGGSIHRNYDLFMRHQLHLIGEKIFRVRHCLIGWPGAQLSDLTLIMSHPQALAQCEHYITRLGIQREVVYDTAGAVKILKDSGRRDHAAIASRRAAEFYEMQIIEESVEDDEANYTRFVVLACEPIVPQSPAKTSIVFTLKNQPGALFKALSVFALRDLDLTKIESRPLAGTPWDYLFYLDFIGSASDENARRALDHLSEYATTLRILGSYSRDMNFGHG
ncbi:MAG: prephenate dehydratase [Chloroflexi bacterium]|nr:prephenate dehydratase [Chloroflexota bacterium]